MWKFNATRNIEPPRGQASWYGEVGRPLGYERVYLQAGVRGPAFLTWVTTLLVITVRCVPGTAPRQSLGLAPSHPQAPYRLLPSRWLRVTMCLVHSCYVSDRLLCVKRQRGDTVLLKARALQPAQKARALHSLPCTAWDKHRPNAHSQGCESCPCLYFFGS
jgi:hypothetical protein